MKKAALAFFVLCPALAPALAWAQSASPEMFGVREVVIDKPYFSDPQAASSCGIKSDEVSAALARALAGTGVPAVPVAQARPTSLGVARIELIPQVASHAGDSLDCTSWVTLSAESRANVVVPPVSALRGVTIVYWRQQTMVASSQTSHDNAVNDVMQKMAAQFAQQYTIDQPDARK